MIKEIDVSFPKTQANEFLHHFEVLDVPGLDDAEVGEVVRSQLMMHASNDTYFLYPIFLLPLSKGTPDIDFMHKFYDLYKNATYPVPVVLTHVGAQILNIKN